MMVTSRKNKNDTRDLEVRSSYSFHHINVLVTISESSTYIHTSPCFQQYDTPYPVVNRLVSLMLSPKEDMTKKYLWGYQTSFPLL